MNDTLQNVMVFINQNTYLLIGICIFLIFVLLGYLLDNSSKSKRVRKDIKNKDQVPENIKKEIIKDAIDENKDKIMENSFHNAVREENNDIVENKIEEEKVDVQKQQNIEFQNEENNLNEPLILDSIKKEEQSSQFDSSDMIFDVDIKNEPKEVTIDPDMDIMSFINSPVSDDNYKNDKKLSEILSSVEKNTQSNTNNDIFSSKQFDLNVESSIDNEPVTEYNATDELERIMKKLSSINNNDEDNYTNIF